ncbi:hypothetical protein D3C79_560050 [compost metagenome]
MAHRVPLGDVVQHPREEARLGGPQQEAHHIEAVGPGDKRHADSDRAPGQQNAGEPATCTEAVEQQVARHFEKKITDEEQPGAKAICRVTQAYVGAHVQLGKAHRRTIDIGHQVKQNQKRDEFQCDQADEPLLLNHGDVSNCSCNGHSTWPGLFGRPLTWRIDHIVLLFKTTTLHRCLFSR